MADDTRFLTTVLDVVASHSDEPGLPSSIEDILRHLKVNEAGSPKQQQQSVQEGWDADVDLGDFPTTQTQSPQWNVSVEAVDRVIAALERRIKDVESGLLHVKTAELENALEAIRVAETEQRLKKIHETVDSFKESAEACKLILTEFGDLVDAVDTLGDLELKLGSITDCEEVVPKSALEQIYEDVRTLIVQRVEDAFSNVFLIQVQENTTTITTKSAVRVSNPETPTQPIFIQTESLLNVIQSLNIHINLYSNLSRSLMKSVLKPIVLNPSCTIISSTSQQQLNTDTIHVGTLTVRSDQKQKPTGSIAEALSKLTTVFKFISANLFTGSNPPLHLVQSLWSNLASTIIDFLVTPLVPTTPESLQQFPTSVASPCIEFENAMEAISWVPIVVVNGSTNNWRHLTGYSASVETHYCMARWESFMGSAREAMVREDFDIVAVGVKGSSSVQTLDGFFKSINKSELSSNLALPLVYPLGSTGAEVLDGLVDFPSCSISARASKIIQLLESILQEAIADGVSAYCASRVYLLSRDLLTLHLNLTPIKHASHLRNLPQFAMIYHNDCLYLAHYLLKLAPQVRYGFSTRFGEGSLLKEAEIGYVDLAAKFRNSGMSVFNSQLMLQKTNVLELISSTNGLGMGDAKRTVEVQKMLGQAMHSVRQLCSVWAPPLFPTFFYNRLVATMAGWVMNAVVDEIEAAIDIGDEESHRLNETLRKLERSCTLLFYGDVQDTSVMEYEEGQRLLRFFLGASFTKFRKLKEMLVMSFAGIMELFRGGRGVGFLHPEEDGGLDEFSNDELSGLVRALFSDTPLRQKNLAEIHMRSK
ncbi:UNVERIFIED_CONTAM: Centromere/kinetochore protein zw10 [Siphonaria sp. JEL0065]|nr:Centromere/kinetochore protein zw10 [Siphonaria sp. JEL0065]